MCDCNGDCGEDRIGELEEEVEFLRDEVERLRAENARGGSLDDLAEKIAKKIMDTNIAAPMLAVSTAPNPSMQPYPIWADSTTWGMRQVTYSPTTPTYTGDATLLKLQAHMDNKNKQEEK